jgi:predicted RNase H-like HicB family nuclease
MKIKVIVHEEDDVYWAEVPSLPGCFTQADTWPELLQNLYEAIEGWLEAKAELESKEITEKDQIYEIAI